jgi:hypothetical protein
MRKWLPIILFLICTASLQAQKDSLDTRRIASDLSGISVSIFPVPVTDHLTIRCNAAISAVKITNIIGQDVYRAQYKNPQNVTDILLMNSQKRGMYLVTIIFTDGRRVVKKILIEEST